MRDDILAALAARQETVDFDGRKVGVRELDCAADLPQESNGVVFSLRLVIQCVTDADGNPIFTEDDLPKLKRASRRRIKPLIDAVMRVNGFALEAEVKNSEAAPVSG